jgi:hypothetical protein
MFFYQRGVGVYIFLASAFGWQQSFMAIKNHSEEWLLKAIRCGTNFAAVFFRGDR